MYRCLSNPVLDALTWLHHCVESFLSVIQNGRGSCENKNEKTYPKATCSRHDGTLRSLASLKSDINAGVVTRCVALHDSMTRGSCVIVSFRLATQSVAPLYIATNMSPTEGSNVKLDAMNIFDVDLTWNAVVNDST